MCRRCEGQVGQDSILGGVSQAPLLNLLPAAFAGLAVQSVPAHPAPAAGEMGPSKSNIVLFGLMLSLTAIGGLWLLIAPR